MDWFTWLSKSGLDPGLVYEYSLEFTRNELQAEDLPHFDHEFLQSMGISVAKHRLEILKLARKDSSRLGKQLSGLFSAIHRTKRSVGKYIGKLISHEEAAVKESHEAGDGSRENWRLALTRQCKSDKEGRPAVKHRSLALSGPLDGKYQHKYLTAAHRSPKLSGPLVYGPKSPMLSAALDVKSHEKAMRALRSPKLSGPLDGWAVNRSPKLSGPLDGRQVTNKNLKFSGPLERTTNKSPRVSGSLEGMGPGMRMSPKVHGNGNFDVGVIDAFDEHSLWAKLFHDMKPT
ncbi:hypothetical protein CRG98_026947 [Punica granatum]|uniref:SAM domain-containing protein n=1 Tax=Punica granatum TaxID=22663 RepID=A0A2I0J8P2_PUNGR|nr:hypothetical protein CRG98_026947 [Punica granatum]